MTAIALGTSVPVLVAEPACGPSSAQVEATPAAGSERAMTLFGAVAVWVGLELAVVGALVRLLA